MLRNHSEFYCFSNTLNLLVLCSLCFLMYWAHNTNVNGFEWVPYIKTCAISLLLFQLFIIYIRKIWWFDFIVVFTILNYLFIESYLFIWDTGIKTYKYWLMNYTSQQWLKGFVYGLCYIHAIFTGYLLSSQNRVNKRKERRLQQKYSSYTLYRIGWILFLISLPFKFYVDIMTYIVNRSGLGYSAVLSNEQVSGVAFNLSMLVNVGIIYIICSKYLVKKQALILFLTYFAYAVGITALVGGRRFTITALLATVPCYIFSYGIKIRKKQAILLGGCGYLGLVFLKTVSATRESLANSFSDYIHMASEYLAVSDVFFDFFYEFGNTIFPYIVSLDVFPKYQSFFWGVSLVAVWILVIPGAGKIFPQLRHAISTSSYARAHYNYWYGGALGQELYGNFGYFAIGGAVIIGRLFNYLLGSLKSVSNISVARYFTLYYALLNFVRADLNEFVRLIVWAYVLPILIKIFFFKNAKN